MASNKICCEETKVEQNYEMNDRDYLNDILSGEKAITVNTATAVTEASNEKLRKEFLNFFDTVKELQSSTFELAWNNGWYSLEESEKTKLKEKTKELQKKLDELSK